MDATVFLVLLGVALAIAVVVWMRREAEADRDYNADNPHAPLGPRPLTFGSIVGAIILGNVATAILFAIFWAILVRDAFSRGY